MAALQPALSTALTVGNLGLSSYALEVSQASAEAARCGAGHRPPPLEPALPLLQVNQALLKEDDDLLRQTFLSVFKEHHPQVPARTLLPLLYRLPVIQHLATFLWACCAQGGMFHADGDMPGGLVCTRVLAPVTLPP